MTISKVQESVAIVTGGGSGISLALVRMLLDLEFRVAILDLVLGDGKQLVEGANLGSSSRVLFIPCDVSDWAQVEEAFGEVRQNLGPPDLVVNGAGVYEPDWSSFWKDTETSSYKTLDINLAASIKITRLAFKEFLSHGKQGTVINISSIAGQRASFYCPLYTASKWAISGFTRAMAQMEKAFNIRVMAVAPGIVRTPLWTASPKGSMLTTEDAWVEPEEVAGAIVDMMTDREQYRGGDVLEVLSKSRRLVPLALPLPSGPGATVSNGAKQVQLLLAELQKERSLL